jgi:hypothetical protein
MVVPHHWMISQTFLDDTLFVLGETDGFRIVRLRADVACTSSTGGANLAVFIRDR